MRPGADNLIRYAVSNYARGSPRSADENWHQAHQFADIVSHDVAHHSVPVTYLGLWDTIKAPGVLRRSTEWPVTRELPNVLAGRHAVSIDENAARSADISSSRTGPPCTAPGDPLWYARPGPLSGPGSCAKHTGKRENCIWCRNGRQSQAHRFDSNSRLLTRLTVGPRMIVLERRTG